MYNTVIRGGTVVDGSGAVKFTGDVAVDDGTITAVSADARRLVQKGSGYVGTWCAGVQTVDHDSFTGELPGQLVRGPRNAHSAHLARSAD